MTGRIDYTRKDYAALREGMLALARETLPEWTDHSPNDLGVVLVELFAHLGDTLMYAIDRVAAEGFLDTASERRSVVDLLRLIGYEMRPPQPAKADLWVLFDDPQLDVTIPRFARFGTTKKAAGRVIDFYYLGDPIAVRQVPPVTRAGLERELVALGHSAPTVNTLLGDLPRVTDDGAPYRLGRLILSVVAGDGLVGGAAGHETVGSADGRLDQRLRLARTPLVDGSLTLEISQIVGHWDVWDRQSSLIDSGPADRHFTVRRDADDAAWIEFGDGRTGAVPQGGIQNNIRARYLVGGGPRGNVPALSITKPSGLDAAWAVFNPRAATGGMQREALAEARRRAPRRFRARERAVTASDYEALARDFGVGKARARAAGWGRVELFIAPAGGGPASDALRADVHGWLEPRRMLGAELVVLGAIEAPFTASAEVLVAYGHDRERVRERAAAAVERLYAFDAVDFGATLYLSKVYEALEGLDGVEAVLSVQMHRGQVEGQPGAAAPAILQFDPFELPVGMVRVTARGGL